MAPADDPAGGWIWSPEAHDYYRQVWDGANWNTYWYRQVVPAPATTPSRRDSAHVAESFQSEPPAEATQGETIPSDSVAVREDASLLDPSYMIQPHARRFFTTGRMFSILFTEPLGATASTTFVDNVSTIMFNEQVYSNIRRFIVVKDGRGGFCYACPVSTYGGRGTGKRGLNPRTHAIVYTIGSTPQHVSGEGELEKIPIAVLPADESMSLTAASRINFAIHHPIQHNVKVKNLGMVHPSSMPYLISYARNELGW